MRIFLLHYYLKQPNPAYGQLANALRGRGHDVWVGAADDQFDLVWHDGKTVVDRCVGPGNRTGRPDSHLPALQDWRFVRRVRQSIRRHEPDLVQVNPASFPYVWALPQGNLRGTRFVIDWRQVGAPAAAPPSTRIKQIVRQAARSLFSRYRFDRATFLHEAAARLFMGTRWSRWATVVPLGVDSRFLRAASQPRPAGHSRKVRFLYVGSLSRVRHLEHLLAAAAILKQATNRFELHLVGPDNAEGYYQAEIRRLGLDDVAAVLPAVAYLDIPRLVADADVALAYVPADPSDWQYQPTLKVLEYRAIGIPMIATDVPPNREEVDHGGNGLLCANDPAAWADAMATFVSDSARLAGFSDRAQSMRRRIPTWSEIAELYERDVYLPVVSGVSSR